MIVIGRIAQVDKIIALQPNRASCPTALTLHSEQFNLNHSLSSVHSSSSNISIERLTATDDEVIDRTSYCTI